MANLETSADMSLLLEARRKSRQAQAAQPDGAPDLVQVGQFDPGASDNATQPADRARDAGHRLFAAKSPFPVTGHTLPNRNLLYALGGTLLLLAVGMAYFWYENSASGTTPLQDAELALPIHIPPAAGTAPAARVAPDTKTTGAGTVAGNSEKTRLATVPAESAPAATPPPSERHRAAPLPNATAPRPGSSPVRPDGNPIRIEQRRTESVDPLLEGAYLAYRGGKLDEARRLYLAMLEKDAHNPDALLGLAAIAQRHGENRAAAQYFGRVLALDPRNAAANAGMSALSTDEDYSESRLKILLREQGDSATLHFALGNLYAGQARWGEAQHAYFNAYALEPGNAGYAFNLAVSLDHIGQKKLAARHYLRAMQLDPSRSAGFDHAQISQRAQELARQ